MLDDDISGVALLAGVPDLHIVSGALERQTFNPILAPSCGEADLQSDSGVDAVESVDDFRAQLEAFSLKNDDIRNMLEFIDIAKVGGTTPSVLNADVMCKLMGGKNVSQRRVRF